MLGLGLLSKYTAVLLVAGAGLYVLTRRDQWRWLATPGPYVALGIAALLFTPVLLWNARHHWVSFAWQSTRGLDELQGLRLDWMMRNIAGQALFLLPWVWLLLVVELVRSFRAGTPARRFIACLAVVPIVLFTAVTTYAATGQRHFHWGMPGYLLLFLPLGETVHRGHRAGPRFYRWGLGVTAALSLLVMTVATGHVAAGWLQSGPAWLAGALPGTRMERSSASISRRSSARSMSAVSSADATSSSSPSGGSDRARWTMRSGASSPSSRQRDRSAQLRVLRPGGAVDRKGRHPRHEPVEPRGRTGPLRRLLRPHRAARHRAGRTSGPPRGDALPLPLRGVGAPLPHAVPIGASLAGPRNEHLTRSDELRYTLAIKKGGT